MEYEVEEVHGPGLAPEFGAIFMSNTATKRECFRRNILAFPYYRANFVKQIKEGTVLFVFENENRELFGVYQATSDGGMNISSHPFVFQGKHLSAQVSFAPIWECDPLSENEFHDAIRENYYTSKKFHFGLSRKQVYHLLCLFSAKKLPPRQPSQIVTRIAGKASRVSSRERLGTAIHEDDFLPNTRSGVSWNSPHIGIEADENMVDVDYRVGNGEDINFSRGNLLTDQANDSLHARRKVYGEYADIGSHDSHITSLAYRTGKSEVSLDKERTSATYRRSPVPENYGNDCDFYTNLPHCVGTDYSKVYSNAKRGQDYERSINESINRHATDSDKLLATNTPKSKLHTNGFRHAMPDEEDFFKRPERATDSTMIPRTRSGQSGSLGFDCNPAAPPKYYDNYEHEVKGTSGGSTLLMDRKMGAVRNLDNGLEFSLFSEKSQNSFESSHLRIHDARRLLSRTPLYEPSGYGSKIQMHGGGDFRFSNNSEMDVRHGAGNLPRSVLSNSLGQSFLDTQISQQKALQNLSTSKSTYHDSVVTRVIPSDPERSTVRRYSPGAGFDRDASLSVNTRPVRDLFDFVKKELREGQEHKYFRFPSHDSAVPFTSLISQDLELRSSPGIDVSSLHAPSNYGSLPFTESYPLRESPLAPENRMLGLGFQEHDQCRELSHLLEQNLANEELGYDEWFNSRILTDDGQPLNPEHTYSGPEMQRKSVFSRLASRPRVRIQETNEKNDTFYMNASVDEVMEMLNFRQNAPQKCFTKFKTMAGRHDRDEIVKIGKRDSPERPKKHVGAHVDDGSSGSIAEGMQEMIKESRELEFKRRRDLKNGLDEDSAKSNLSRKEDSLSREKPDSEVPVNKQQKRRKLVRPNFGGSDSSVNPASDENSTGSMLFC